MSKLKYVFLKSVSSMDDVPFIFPDYIGHDDFVRAMSKTKEDVASAGFCSIGISGEYNQPTWNCYGESRSLDIKSRPERDSKKLNNLINPYL